ncbi:hypothetical protein SAMN05216389_11934 [Oceanobacillus limi]|uniref:N-acetyltransferase domain-containing protein n=1 Tax=Oceanobacillus limi TaxID=930131 RepID=A0A1I0G5Y1_9BACI|nr:hypothetical protein [Oceanobacillus limi]SET66181.1 hypothetical protein SAMN05216389_11934 [Oceanobacillus limi]
MNIISAKDTPIIQLEEFLQTTPDNVRKDSLLEYGYVVEISESIKGCFVLEPVNEGVFWLKQLYVSQEEAANLPVLLETIIAMAKGLHAKKLYVHSHQPVVDILLDALQFHPQERALLVDNPPRARGNWWAYDVS